MTKPRVTKPAAIALFFFALCTLHLLYSPTVIWRTTPIEQDPAVVLKHEKPVEHSGDESRESPPSSWDLCVPRTNIVFLKTHKCASSTLMNIFLRFGVAHDLNFVLPSDNTSHYIGHPEPFQPDQIENITQFNMAFNILTHHTRLNHDEIRRVMPSDSVYVTVLRRPDALFESLYAYYNLPAVFKKNLTEFVLDNWEITNLTKNRICDRVGFNQMSFDLGFSDILYLRPNAIAEFIESVEKLFHLVMITDRFDESLILLKHLLCWNTTEMVSFKVNARYATYKEKLSNYTRARLLHLNSVDASLYDHFAKIFEQRVNDFGVDRMTAEIRELDQARRTYYTMCVKSEMSLENVSTIDKRKDIIAFQTGNASSEVCRQLTMNELQFHEFVRKKQAFKIKQAQAQRSPDGNPL